MNKQPTILCVDDEPVNLSLLKTILTPLGYRVIFAENGKDALEKLIGEPIDLVLLDLMMPEMDGFEVCRRIKSDEVYNNIPIIMLIAHAAKEYRIKGIEAGMEDFISKPFDSAEVLARVAMLLRVKGLSEQVSESEDAFAYTVLALARAAEANDDDTGNHILRVGDYCALLAEQMGMPEEFILLIRTQSILHDTGKIHLSPEILKKPGGLSAEEFELMKQHPVDGAKYIGDHVRLAMAKSIAISHHERWDGSGYPYRLIGAQIPIEGRILNLADQYDALRNERCYKPAFDHDKTFQIITEGDGRTIPQHFDPRVLDAFKAVHGRFAEIFAKMG